MNKPYRRIMVVDDNSRIHNDFEKVFKSSGSEDAFDAVKDELFGTQTKRFKGKDYRFNYYISGEVAVDAIRQSCVDNDPFALAFVDIRMPGWDGIKTIQEIWKIDSDIQIVICTAYTDYSWNSIVESLGEDRSFLVLKKPFDVIEVKQLAHMLTSKWQSLLQERENYNQLNEALVAKDVFLARVSHELRTPLHGIIGIVDLIKETKLDDQQVDFVHTLDVCGESLNRIIDDILDYSAIEEGRFSLSPENFNLFEFLKDLERQFRIDALSRGIDLEFEIDQTLPPWVVADVTRLTQILGNLLRNSFKFTSDGRVVLKVNAGDSIDGLVHMKFNVKDTGVGIPDSFMTNLFIPFSQAENVDSRRFGGTGLGLAISKGLIESMKGSITVESEIGVGTSVKFDLLVEKGMERDSVEEVAISQIKDNRNIRVLAVDDSVTNRKVIQNQLFWLGYECEAVNGCDEAIVSLSMRKFDLILMDCQMPGIDGFEATRKIREIYPEYENIPIVALSANIDRSTQEKCQWVGMDGFISKPARKSEIESSLRAILKQKKEKPISSV